MEAGADATEKQYCDEQLAKTNAKRDELNAETSRLTAKIDRAASQSASLKQEVRDAQADLAKLAKEQAEMDRVRNEAHAAYTQAKTDLELGIQGVRKALNILREYYGPSSL